jgi:hypothetical protein
MITRCIAVNLTETEYAPVDFGVRDSRDRLIGAVVGRWLTEFVPYDPGAHALRVVYDRAPGLAYSWWANATRDGRRFGPSQPARDCATAEEREEQIARYLRDAQRRAFRKM